MTLQARSPSADDQATVEACPRSTPTLAPGDDRHLHRDLHDHPGRLDAGGLTNTASASADGTVTSNTDDQATVIADQGPEPRCSAKTADARRPTTPSATSIAYSYVVTNTGNVTLDRAGHRDRRQGAASPARRAHARARRHVDLHGDLHHHPGRPRRRLGHEHRDSAHRRRRHLATTDTETVTAAQGPRPDAWTRAPRRRPTTAVGDAIAYSFLVTNTGNVTLAGPVTVTDDKVTVTCPARRRSAPARRHDLHRDATRSPRPTSMPAASPTSPQRMPTVGHLEHRHRDRHRGPGPGADAWTRAPRPRPTTRVGDVIDYSYVVTNTGNVTLTGPVTVTDDQVDRDLPGHGDARRRRVDVTCTATLHDHPGRPRCRHRHQHRHRPTPTARSPRTPTPRPSPPPRVRP